MADEYTLGHNVSSADRASAVVGITQLPSTVLPDQNEPVAAATQQQISAPQRTSSTEDLINSAIQRKSELQQQRLGLTNQRSQLIQQMSGLHLGSHGRPTPQSRAIEMQMHGLDRQERDLENQDKFVDFQTSHRISSAMKDASSAEKFAKDTLAHKTAQQAGEVFLKGTELMGKYKPGTPEFQDEMTKLRDQYPLGFASEAVKGHFGQIAKFHDAELQRTQNKLSDQLLKVGLSPDQFSRLENVRGTTAATGSTPEQVTAGQKGVGAKGEKAPNIAFDIDGQTFVVGKTLFNTLSKHFPKQTPQQRADTAQATSNADAYAQSQGFRDSAQLERYKAGGPLTQPPTVAADEGRATRGFPTIQGPIIGPGTEPILAGHAAALQAAKPEATVKMQSPDGVVRDVPSSQAEHYRALGAKLLK